MQERVQGLGVEDALRILVKVLPDVSARLRRLKSPPELRQAYASIAPRHIPALTYVLDDGPMAVSELAARLGLALTTTSLMVRELADHGLVERREDETDRRRTMVRLAADRRTTIAACLGQRSQPVRRMLEKLSAPERAALCRGLSILQEELGIGQS